MIPVYCLSNTVNQTSFSFGALEKKRKKKTLVASQKYGTIFWYIYLKRGRKQKTTCGTFLFKELNFTSLSLLLLHN